MIGTRRVRRAGGAAAVAASLVAVGVVAGANPTPPRRVDLRSGAAWVVSADVGLLTLIDGATAQVAARVDVGPGSGTLVATQAGPVGYAADGDRGTLVRVDPRTFEAGEPVAALDHPSGHVIARATESRVYLVDEEQGRVVSLDAHDPRRGARPAESLAEGVGSSAVDQQGRLWVLGARSGDLVWFGDGPRHRRAAVVHDPAGAELVAVDGAPVLVDRSARRARSLGSDGRPGRGACIDMEPGDDSVRFGGSQDDPVLYSVSGRQRTLRVSDLGTGRCADVAISVFPRRAELGAPVESGGRVFVPNYTTGQVAVVDVARRKLVATTRALARGRFDLFERDGIVFYNDPDSNQAGVIHVDGTFQAVAKYNPADPNEGVDNHGPGRPRPVHPTPNPSGPGGRGPSGPTPTTAGGSPPTGPVPTGVPDPGGTTPGATAAPGPTQPGRGGHPSPTPPDTRPRRPDETVPTTSPTTSPSQTTGPTAPATAWRG